MLLPLTSDQLAAFRAFLSSSEDAEPLGGEEYSCDLYELDPPVSLEIALTGSGVGNHRSALNQQSLGVPVLAVGMPMVVYAATIARDALELLSEGMQQDDQLDEALDELAGQLSGNAVGDMIVTPREVDSLIDQAAWVLARGINRALQPALSDEEIQTMME